MSTPVWSGSKVRALKRNLRARGLPCALCGQPIDYTLPDSDPQSFSYDHIKPQSTHPHLVLEPTNGQPAHRRCNLSKGVRAERLGLGMTTSGW